MRRRFVCTRSGGAFLCTTISPALPYALFDPAISGASEKDQYNGRIVFDGVVESARTALANGIPVGLGNDVGCPYITQYDFWRELCYFHKYCGVSNRFALHTATLRNARLAGVGDVTGSIEAGKSADFIVTRRNPLDDLTACASWNWWSAAAVPCTSPLPSGTKRWMPCLTRIWHKCYNILKFRPCQSGR